MTIDSYHLNALVLVLVRLNLIGSKKKAKKMMCNNNNYYSGNYWKQARY